MLRKGEYGGEKKPPTANRRIVFIFIVNVPEFEDLV